jgi:uncharacterized membrane protein
MKTSNKRLIGILCAIPVLLSVPLIAMQFTGEVNWTLSDFIIMGILLLITGLTIEMVLRKAKTSRSRFIVTAVVLFIFFLIWAELAVGVFGTPFAGS